RCILALPCSLPIYKHQHERRLRADQRLGDVEALLGQEPGQVVAGATARDLGKDLAALLGIVVAEVAQMRVDLAAAAAASDDALKVILVGSAKWWSRRA